MSDPFIELDEVFKYYNDTLAVADITLHVREGEFLALLGPSGAGKSTLLRILAGFESPSSGVIKIDGEDITPKPPHQRKTSTVFQDYNLFPHMSVEENIEFGLKNNGYSRSDREDRITNILDILGMSEFRERYPSELSGGQQQRIATARAIAIEPQVLLMDEPLGALDKQLRDRLQVDLIEIQQKLNTTTLYVTHNQSEALSMADRIAVMNRGKIEQIGTPQEIYNNPKSEFVADFIGHVNFIDQDTVDRHDIVSATAQPDKDAIYFVRPNNITLEPPSHPVTENGISGVVREVLFMGSTVKYLVESESNEYRVDLPSNRESQRFTKGDAVTMVWSPENTRTIRK